MISRLTRSALCCCMVMPLPVLFSCLLFPFTTYYTCCICKESSQKSGMVSLHDFRYASCSGVFSTSEEEKQSKGEPIMSHEENKAVVSRFVEEFWNQGNTPAADDPMTADAPTFLPGSGEVSKESFKAFVTAFRRAFPDWHSTQEEMIPEEDRAAERGTGREIHKGEFQRIGPTGRRVTVRRFGFNHTSLLKIPCV